MPKWLSQPTTNYTCHHLSYLFTITLAASKKKNKVDYYAPTVLLAFGKRSEFSFVLGYNIGISWDGIEKTEYLAILSLGYGLSYWWSFWRIFSLDRLLTNHNIDFGASYLLSSDLLLDFAVGHSFWYQAILL
ncbi:MAG: hypothetical protein IPK94_22710 [Saprospiraceae bacterium]|nr:hypothetical protein [Saprospiraceae bacterium]